MGFKKVSLYLSWFAILSSFMFACISAAQISEADLLTLTKQEIDNDLERLFEYVKTTSDGVRLGCKGKVRKGDTGKVQALFIEDSVGRREFRKLGPITATVKNFLNQEESKYVPLRDFPMYCLERVFHSSSCPPGPPGRMGRDGREGTIGAPGFSGAPGKDGIAGGDGYPGPRGPAGSPGRPGDRGTRATPKNGQYGDRGSVGEKGEAGPQGPEGPRGTDGLDGAPGLAGEPGVPGQAGPAGQNGIDGVDGVDGIAGIAGPSGLPGINGYDGLHGLNGLSGKSGTNGVNGESGINGQDGRPGSDGTCCGQGQGGWSSGSDSETCSVDLGLSQEEEVLEVDTTPETVAEHSIEDNVKAEVKPAVSKPSFWSSSNDMFAPLHPYGGLGLKNTNGKHKKDQQNSTKDSAKPHSAPVPVAPKVVEKNERVNPLPAKANP